MKKNIIKIVMLFAMFVSINVFAQSTSKVVLVQTTSLAQGGQLSKLTYGKLQGFSADKNAFVVIPNDDNATTLANLENELKAIAPTTTTDAFKLSTPKARTNVPAINQAKANTAAPAIKANNTAKVADKATLKPNVVSASDKVVAPSTNKQEPVKVATPVERRNVPAIKASDVLPKDKVAPSHATAPVTKQSTVVKVNAPATSKKVVIEQTPADKAAARSKYLQPINNNAKEVKPVTITNQPAPVKVTPPKERRNVPAIKSSDKQLSPQEKKNLLNNK